MKYILKLAFANILRERRRTFLTFIVLALGMTLFIFFSGLIRGMQDKQLENLIEFDTAHFKIRSAAYDEERPYAFSNYITNYREIEAELGRKSYVTGFTERIAFFGEIDNGVESFPVTVNGINPETDPKVFSLTNFITTGSFKAGDTVIGANLARDMKLGVGDDLYLTFQNGQGAIDSIAYTVSGIIESADPQVNNSSIFINIGDAKKALNIDSVMEIAVKTPDYHRFAQWQPDLSKINGNIRVENWKKLGEYYLKFAKADETSAYLIVFFIFVIALVGIINTMLLSVFEKKKEIGTLKALGMKDRDILALFVFEGFWISFMGCLAGLLVGGLLVFIFSIVGMDFTAMVGGSDVNIGYKLMGVVKAKWDVPVMAEGIAASIVLSCLASFYPAWKATRMQPVDCLRTFR